MNDLSVLSCVFLGFPCYRKEREKGTKRCACGEDRAACGACARGWAQVAQVQQQREAAANVSFVLLCLCMRACLWLSFVCAFVVVNAIGLVVVVVVVLFVASVFVFTFCFAFAFLLIAYVLVRLPILVLVRPLELLSCA